MANNGFVSAPHEEPTDLFRAPYLAPPAFAHLLSGLRLILLFYCGCSDQTSFLSHYLDS